MHVCGICNIQVLAWSSGRCFQKKTEIENLFVLLSFELNCGQNFNILAATAAAVVVVVAAAAAAVLLIHAIP